MGDPSRKTGAYPTGPAAFAVAAVLLSTVPLPMGAPQLAALLPPAQAQQVPATQQTQEETPKPAGYRLGDLTVGDVWVHQSTNRDGAAYLRIGNAGPAEDALIDASTPFAKRVELRGPVPGGAAWETGRIDAVPVPAGQEIVLDAAALYLGLVGLRGILSVGETVRITLTFEQAGAITVKARVLSPNEAAAIIEKAMPQRTPPGSSPEPPPESPPELQGAPGSEPTGPAGSRQ